jgi:hypothetical protein
VYGSCWTPTNPEYTQLSTVIRTTNLNGLVYVQPTSNS